MLYKQDSLVKLATSLKINFRTFKKYLNKCIELGMIKSQGEHLYVINYRDLIKNWCGIDSEHNKKLQKFFTHVFIFNKTDYGKKNPSFKDIYNQIIDSVIIKNFQQQEYKINKQKKTLDLYQKSSKEGCHPTSKREYKLLKSLVKEAAQRGLTTEQYIKRISKKTDWYIKTGKNHISKLIGMSSSTGQIRLKKLQKENKIQREIILVNTGLPVIDECFQILKKETKHLIVPKGNVLFISKGSRIGMDTYYLANDYSVEKIGLNSSNRY